jgi:hypothetical protein
MLIGTTPLLTPDLAQLMSDGIDDMLASFGKLCKLVFAGTSLQFCSNCVYDSMAHRSTNVYKPGGPKPFGRGQICPVCNGAGTVGPAERYQDVKLICRWNPSDFILLPGNIQVPFSVVETEGSINDLPAVLQSRVILIEIPIQPFIHARFELQGEPVDVNSIVQGKTFVCHWNRKG